MGRVSKGLFYTISARYGNQVITILLNIVLARLLTPYDYGLIGMISVLVAIGILFTNLGVVGAIIQKESISQIDLSTSFWSNLAISLLMTALLWLTAGLISSFYDEGNLTWLIRIYSLTFIISALSVTQTAQMRRQFMFGKIEFFETISTTVAGAAAIITALNNFGFWSLVVQRLTYVSFRFLLVFISVRWVPDLSFSLASFRKIFGYGTGSLGIKLIRQLANKLDTILIGKKFTASELGLYTRGEYLSNVPVNNLVQGINSVTFPLLSRLQGRNRPFNETVENFSVLSSIIVWPLMYLMWNHAYMIIDLILGEKWLALEKYLKWFIMVQILTPYGQFALNALLAKGLVKKALYNELFNKCTLILFLTGAFFTDQIELFIVSKAVSMILLVISSYLILNRNTLFSTKQLVIQLIKKGLFTLLLAILLHKIALVNNLGEWTAITIFVISYAIVTYFYNGKYIASLIRK